MITGILNISLLGESKPKYIKTMGAEGWAKFRHLLEKEKVSEIINDTCILKTYAKWNDKVMEIKNQCNKKA